MKTAFLLQISQVLDKLTTIEKVKNSSSIISNKHISYFR